MLCRVNIMPLNPFCFCVLWDLNKKTTVVIDSKVDLWDMNDTITYYTYLMCTAC